MTNWRAVGIGLAIELILGFVGLLVPGIGQFIAGLVGGFVAGYIASTSIRSGLWHGLLAGSLGGFLLAVPIGIVVGVASIGLGLMDQFGSLVAGLGTTVVVLFIAVILGANSALGGALGSLVRDVYESRSSGQPTRIDSENRLRTTDGSSRVDRTVSTPDTEKHSSSPKLVDSILDREN